MLRVALAFFLSKISNNVGCTDGGSRAVGEAQVLGSESDSDDSGPVYGGRSDDEGGQMGRRTFRGMPSSHGNDVLVVVTFHGTVLNRGVVHGELSGSRQDDVSE